MPSGSLDEAERLCDRVAILNTTLRTIGRPEELRDPGLSESQHSLEDSYLELLDHDAQADQR
jgi:ABC-type multidrug transport system ATPase subunit